MSKLYRTKELQLEEEDEIFQDTKGEMRQAPKDQPKLRFQLVSFDDLKWSGTSEYLVKGVLPRTGLALIWGPPKCGKSFWMLTVAMHIAMGRDYRDHRVNKQEVVYLALEGQSGFGKRAEAFRQYYLQPNEKVPGFKLCGVPLDLIADHKQLIKDVQDQAAKPGCLVIDTLNRSLNGSEGKDEDMSAYLQAATAIQEAFKCLVVVIHHCGVDGTRPRGHTSQTGAADVQISVKKDAAGIIHVSVDMAKDMEEGTTFASKLERVEIGSDQDGDQESTCVVVPCTIANPAPKTAKGIKAPKAVTVAMKALREALDAFGAVPPASNYVPPNTKTVAAEEWRKFAYKFGISTGEERAQQKAFKTAFEHLTSTGEVGAWEEQVWLTK
jgi:hypothetical protein